MIDIPIVKHHHRKLSTVLKVAFLSLSLSVLVVSYGCGTKPTKTDIPTLIENLGDYQKRDEAIEELTERGSESVPALIEALKSENEYVRSNAAEALGNIGKEAAPAVPALIAALKDENEYVRSNAAEALGNIGKEAAPAVPALIAALKDENEYVRIRAANTLGNIGGKPASAVPALIAALKDENEDVRRGAAFALGNIGEKAPSAVPALIAALKDQDSFVRYNAADALVKIGEKAASAVPALIAALKDENEYVRSNAAFALGNIGEKAPSAVPALIAALKDENKYVRSGAAFALGNIGEKAASAVPALIAALKDENKYVRIRAAFALGNIGEKAASAVPALIAALKDENENVRRGAAFALGNIGEKAPSAVPALIAALKDEDANVRRGAAEALGNIGEKAPSAVPALIAALKDEDANVRSNAAFALGKIGEKAAPAVPALIAALKDENFFIRSNAAEALGKIGEKAASAVPALIAALKDENFFIRSGAAEALKQIGLPSLPHIIPALVNENTIIRSKAAAILWELIGTQIIITIITLLLITTLILWKKPQLLLRLIAAQAEQKELQKFLPIAETFFNQAAATTTPRNKRCLIIEDIPGRIKSYQPIPVILALTPPTKYHITELHKLSQQLTGKDQKQAGIIIYQESPNALFRLQMAEVRLSDQFPIIPLSCAEVEKALLDNASSGILAEYAERYLPGADLFDDKNAISDTLSFFGRNQLLQHLIEDLQRNQGIGLFGLRKSGKTSILHQLSFALRQHPIVHIDLQKYGGQTSYMTDIFNEIIQQLNKLTISPSVKEAGRGREVGKNILSPSPSLPIQFTQEISHLANRLKTAGYHLPILCFLDEIERIIPTPSDSRSKAEEFNAIFGVLRGLSQSKGVLSLLVADVHPDCNRINQWQQSDVPSNPVYNFFKEIFLPPFTPEDTKKMITDIGQLMGKRFDEQTISSLHYQSGGHPFITRQLASLLCKKIPTEINEIISYEKAQRYLKNPFPYSGVLKDYFPQNIWGDLEKRQFTVAKMILKILACNSKGGGDKEGAEAPTTNGVSRRMILGKLGGEFSESQLLDGLLWLESMGLIARQETVAEDYYLIQIPLLCKWLNMDMVSDEFSKLLIAN